MRKGESRREIEAVNGGSDEENENFIRKIEKVGQEQIHGLLFEEKLSWQAIIYDLIKTEQLDPWDIDIAVLSQRYLEKIKVLEEANFFISSQVLLAAALLLRLKSEILLDEYLPTLDAILFNKKQDEKKYLQQKLEIFGDVPELVVRSPLPRYKKVTLDELMKALGNAIHTENRRIRKVVVAKQQEYETALSLPKTRINLKDRIKEVYTKLKIEFSKSDKKIAFSELAGKSKEDRVLTFVPLLHLDNQHKVWLEQEKHFDEIWILLKKMYEVQNAEALDKLKLEADDAIGKLTDEELARANEIERDYKAPVGTGFESDVSDEDDGRESILDSIERNERKEEFEEGGDFEIEREKKEE